MFDAAPRGQTPRRGLDVPVHTACRLCLLWRISGFIIILSRHLSPVRKIIFIRQGEKKKTFAVSSEEELGQNMVYTTARELIRHLYRQTHAKTELPVHKSQNLTSLEVRRC